jgi:hypothetical protein
VLVEAAAPPRPAATARRYLVTGALRAEQLPAGGFAGATFEIAVALVVTVHPLPGAAPQLVRALALAEAAQIAAPDCDVWSWEGRPLVAPLG